MFFQKQFTSTLILGISLCLLINPSESQSTKRTQCGGALTADSNDLIFPGPGESLTPGEVCVWTIHLETTRDFRFNFSQLDVNSTGQSNCGAAGIRLYALNNLVPPDRIESYTFCSENEPPQSFFLSGSVVAVALYVSESNANPGSGIVLNWSGDSFDPLGTKHISSYSEAASGAIRYPIVGEYEPSLAATWTIVSESPNLEFNLESLSLASCSNPDPCTCDALLLYEISNLGVLYEAKRFCNDATNTFVYNMESTFILAFFTDLQLNSAGEGFQSVYYPSTVTNPPTTPTTPPTTTPTQDPTTSQPPTTTEEYQTTKCGVVLNQTTGYILYKDGFTFDPNERCVWTIRVPGATAYRFNVASIGWSEELDGLGIFVTNKAAYPGALTYRVRRTGAFTLDGELAILTFYSDMSVQGQGFSLTYEAFVDPVSNGTSVSRDVILSDAPTASLVHPENGYYNNFELSTFVYTPRFYFNESTTIQANYYLSGLESGCECCDSVAVYVFPQDATGPGFNLRDTLCSNEATVTIDNKDIILFIFSSDNSVAGRGFKVDFTELST